MTDSIIYKRSGPGGLVFLTMVFVILKATGYLHWSWWAVFAPLWILPVLCVIAVTVALLIFGLLLLLEQYQRWAWRRRLRRKSRK